MLTEKRIRKITAELVNLKIRCSAISKIMTAPEADKLSAGAKTYVEEVVDEIVYAYKNEFSSKQTEKGNTVEDASIELYNRVFFTDHEKAMKPSENEFLKTQSCDIDDEKGDKIIDIKSSWTLKTFPKTVAKAKASAKKSGYDWQLDGYMSVFKRKKAEVAYCFIETPEELCQYDEQSLHTINLDLISEEMLITNVNYEFDILRNAQIFARVKLCRIYAIKYFNEILEDHGFE